MPEVLNPLHLESGLFCGDAQTSPAKKENVVRAHWLDPITAESPHNGFTQRFFEFLGDLNYKTTSWTQEVRRGA